MELQYLKGIGPKRAELFHKLGLFSCEDLCAYFPRKYEDRTQIKQIAELEPGETVCITATLAQPLVHSRIRQGLEIHKGQIFDETGSIGVTFFNSPYIGSALRQGETYVFYGKVSVNGHHWEMTNPIAEPHGKSGRSTGRILPIYPSTAGLTQGQLRSAQEQALKQCVETFADMLPDKLRQEYKLCHIRFALENIHFPQSFDMLETARRRLVFDELLTLQAGLLLIKNRHTREKGVAFSPVGLEDFYSTLQFSLTEGQKQAINDALNDMQSGHALNRLVQGDVGSGKTVVAAACALAAARNGFQTAFMVPTEILAEQHFRSLSPLLESLGLSVALLTGSQRAKEKKAALSAMRDGTAGLVIGTHALLSSNVEFSRLGLVITDEQHRFGVRQRGVLANKGGAAVHNLIMSATPIPRTLSKILFGDLDVTVMRGMPHGRTPVDTFPVTEDMRQRIEVFIRKLVKEGRQVYIVCPLIEEDEGIDLKSAEEYSENLRQNVFPELRIGAVHGKMKPSSKEKVMREFADGQIDILVATTVIEVGVNVPNAALMVVENAERFGLSQLHQLRGRVGRGDHKSYCVLFLQTQGETARARLEIMKNETDGFAIAEADLQLRGPGDFFGERQHGLPQFKIADLSNDISVFNESREAAAQLLQIDPELTMAEHAAFRKQVEALIESIGKD